jgi:hypothetical protein
MTTGLGKGVPSHTVWRILLMIPQCLRKTYDVLTPFFVVIAVKTTSYILKKYSNCPPSLIVHLHPTHFRFEQQDGSFPYNSEMKVVIEHIRQGTVPHDLIEELLRSGVRFYEGSFRLPRRLALVVILTVSSQVVSSFA